MNLQHQRIEALCAQMKFARLHADLEAKGATRAFDGSLDAWTYAPLAETDRAARAVLTAMGR